MEPQFADASPKHAAVQDPVDSPRRGRPRKKRRVQGDDQTPPKANTSKNDGNIAAAVKKMKTVLSPKKVEKDIKKDGKSKQVEATNPNDALIHVIQPEDVDEYMDQNNADEDEFAPKASTIIIVKPNTDESTPKPSPAQSKKDRVRTVTMSSGKQYVYKSKKQANKAEQEKEDTEKEDELSEAEQFLNELRDQKNTKSTKKSKKRVSFKKSKAVEEIEDSEEEEGGKNEDSLIKKWKSLGVEGEKLGSGDVVIAAEDLKQATENFVVTINDTEYNFDVQERSRPVPKTSTTHFSVGDGAKRPKIKIEMPIQKAQCMVCGKTLLNYSYLYRHVRHFHKDIQDVDQYLEEIRPLMKVPCPLCGKEISSISNMSSHVQQCHPDRPEPFKCQVCGGFYKTRISLKHHMASQHTPGRKRFPCKYCGNIFTESRSLREHVNCTHETTEVFSCEVCHKTFLTRGRLRRHMYIHGEFRLFCKYCGKGFHLKDNMNKHIDLVHEKKNQSRFKCEYCSKAFNVKGNLMQHINGVHLKTLPYRCPICDQGFRKKGDMLVHMRQHAVKKQDGSGENLPVAVAAEFKGYEYEEGDESIESIEGEDEEEEGEEIEEEEEAEVDQ